ncbi:SPOR domain-containing protein [uncultured Tolumonas sp.]|uniref:SPOR domain-containing protein n=1 Tax=uncultured Tolumonas sp. TaxID=263765 RepID=UPI002930ADC0|nr:SPOR domain-containing protein [uncultured Tolumonas sp.]
MATQFQNRLIGTVILVSLGVIFLPDLLMGKKNDIAAPAGSIPLRPEQSLAAHQNETTVTTTASAAQGNMTVAASGATGVVVANNTATVTTVSAATSAAKPAVNANEQWKVEEVAAPVTITETGVVNDKMASATTEKQQTAELAKAKARELEQKKKEVLAAAKAKELAKTREIALESKKETEIKPIVQESEIRTTETIAPEHQTTTVKRDESGLTIKTPAQVEAERAASKSSTITTTSTTTHTTSKPVTTTAHSGSWIIQVGVFSNAENAQALATKLRSAGYGASAQRAGQLTRVMVGPDVSRDKLQAMLGNINRVGGTSARVIAYSAVGN